MGTSMLFRMDELLICVKYCTEVSMPSSTSTSGSSPGGTSTRLQDKVVLVTGANRGIGEAMVDAVVAAGASKVYAAVRSPETAAPLVDRHGSHVVVPLFMDLSNPSSVHAAAAQATDVHIVINSAGVLTSSHSPLEPQAIHNLQYEMQVNVFGFMHVAQAFAPILVQNASSSISSNSDKNVTSSCCYLVQINSTSSVRQPPNAIIATYAASKAAAYALTQAVRGELYDKNVKVISVHPGPIDTDMARNAGITVDGRALTAASIVADRVVEALGQDEFLVFPDPLSESIGKEYQSYAERIIGNHNMKKGPSG